MPSPEDHSRSPASGLLRSTLQWMRYLSERWLLVPSAQHLPLGTALWLARLIGAVDLIVPTAASKVARTEVQAASGLSGRALWALAWRRLAAPRVDLVWLARMAAGREALDSWSVIERNGDPVHAVLDCEDSVVLVTGHFSTAAFHAVQAVLPRPATFVRGDVSQGPASAAERRRRLFDTLRDSARERLLRQQYPRARLTIRVPDSWGPGGNWNDAAGRAGSVKEMLAAARSPGGILAVRIDAIWGAPGAYERPFAGMTSRPFAEGSIGVAANARARVIPFVAVLGEQKRSVVLEWGEPIPPPRHRGDEERAVLDRAVDFIECAVARNCAAYQAPIGIERSWDAGNASWR